MDADIVTLVKRKLFDEALAALAAGANPEAKKARGESALLWAAIHHRTDVARALLEAGAHPSPRTTGKRAAGIGVGGVTPLHIAAADGDLGLIDVLVRGGAAVDVQDALGNTPLVLPGFRGDPVNVVSGLTRTAPGSQRRDDCGGGSDCRRYRCSQRHPSSLEHFAAWSLGSRALIAPSTYIIRPPPSATGDAGRIRRIPTFGGADLSPKGPSGT